MEVENRQCDFVSPRRSFLKSDSVAASAEEVTGRDEVTVPGSLKLQPRTVPDESFEGSEIVRKFLLVCTYISIWTYTYKYLTYN